jgi:hypothetical protein
MTDIPIYSNAIFADSRCLEKEHTYKQVLHHLLLNLGYTQSEFDVYQREESQVLLALVDDVEHVNRQFHEYFLGTLDTNVTIVTDGWINGETSAKILQLPHSWHGIYYFQPKASDSTIDRKFSFCMNRIEPLRQLIFLLLAQDGLLDQGHVNFNCNHPLIQKTPEPTATQMKKMAWTASIKEVNQLHWVDFTELIKWYQNEMPYRNHDLDHDSAYNRSALNMILETYYGDYSISFSEKIFHALVTPRPWTLFCGKGSVAQLQNLGFDVYHDMIPHHLYDGLNMTQGKIKAWYDVSKTFIQHHDPDRIRDRCLQGAQKNIELLQRMHRIWPADFANWLVQFIDTVG